MSGYELVCQYTPEPSQIPFFHQPGFFFNDPEHLYQQTNGPFYLLTALNQRTGRVEARCAFFVTGDEAVSPAAAPFGSVEFAGTLPEPVLDALIGLLIEAAQSVGTLTTLRLVNYPHCYAPHPAARLLAQLPKHGFRLSDTYQTFFLPITTEPLEQNLKPAERRRLRKCREANFLVDRWVTPDMDAVIDFLGETRRQQGYRLTIQPDALRHLGQKFPEQCLVFRVRDGPKLAALTVAIRVRQDILYHFLPASHPAYQTFSPMVMLTDGLVSYCQRQHIRLLDLGTSLDGDGQPKPSLMRFKRNLGAQESPKLVFERSL